MSVTWSGEGPALLLALDRSDATPLGHQLQDQLRAAVRDGRLRAGERLPSSRRLSEELRVSRGMVVACYEQLIAEGYLVGSAGSGTRVAAGVREPAARSRPAGTTSPTATTRHRVEIDFEYGVPDLRSAPLPDWLWALHEAGRTAPTAVMGDERDAGALRLRQVVAAYHRRVRAGTADAEHAVIVSGFRQGLVLALAALARSGVERVGLEDPGPASTTSWFGARGCIRSPCPSTTTASMSTRSIDPAPEQSSSLRRTSARPGWCWHRNGAMRWSHGQPRSTEPSWRTTTTPSSAMTANPWAPCRDSPPTGS